MKTWLIACALVATVFATAACGKKGPLDAPADRDPQYPRDYPAPAPVPEPDQ